jgi:hypothetical protein
LFVVEKVLEVGWEEEEGRTKGVVVVIVASRAKGDPVHEVTLCSEVDQAIFHSIIELVEQC